MSATTYAVAFGIAAVVFSAHATAAELQTHPDGDNKVTITLAGSIESGDAARLATMIRAENDAGRLVSAVRLHSPGGNLLEGVKLAAIIRRAKIATSVASGALCASACFVAFAAGAEKTAHYQGRVGVHGASDKSGREAGNATVVMARVVKELGVSPAVIGKMVVTPPSQMVWLSPDDLKSMGVTMAGKPAQLPPETTEKPAQLPPATAGKPAQLPPQATGKPAQLPGKPAAQPQQPAESPAIAAAQKQVASAIEARQTPNGKAPSWEELEKLSILLSSHQNNGKPVLVRACQPKQKVCASGIAFKGKEGKQVILRKREDASGQTLSRDICIFNLHRDVRTCLDWDNGRVHRDMKDSRGRWTKVSG